MAGYTNQFVTEVLVRFALHLDGDPASEALVNYHFKKPLVETYKPLAKGLLSERRTKTLKKDS